MPQNEIDCQICCMNRIVKEGEAEGTFVFTCGHRFCTDCVLDNTEYLVDNGKPDEIICMQENCGQKMTQEQLEDLFREEPAMLEKIERFKASKNDQNNPLLRFCTNNKCNSKIYAKTIDDSKLVCE